MAILSTQRRICVLGTTSWFFRLFAAKAGALHFSFVDLGGISGGGLEMELVSVEPTPASVRAVDTDERNQLRLCEASAQRATGSIDLYIQLASSDSRIEHIERWDQLGHGADFDCAFAFS